MIIVDDTIWSQDLVFQIRQLLNTFPKLINLSQEVVLFYTRSLHSSSVADGIYRSIDDAKSDVPCNHESWSWSETLQRRFGRMGRMNETQSIVYFESLHGTLKFLNDKLEDSPPVRLWLCRGCTRSINKSQIRRSDKTQFPTAECHRTCLPLLLCNRSHFLWCVNFAHSSNIFYHLIIWAIFVVDGISVP